MFANKTTIDQQLASNDCGISAVKTVCNALEFSMNRGLIEDHIPLSQQGATLESIHQFFQKFGFSTKFHLLDVQAIAETEAAINELCPCITPVKSRRGLHYVVIERVQNGKFSILDPAKVKSYQVGLQEFKHLAYFSKSNLNLVEVEDILKVKISEALSHTSVKMPEDCTGKILVELFNKINYFDYVKTNYPFQNKNTENEFLSDLIHQQDLAAVPLNFRSLKSVQENVEVEAPILLSIKKTDQVQQQEVDEKESNVYWKLFKSIQGVRSLWFIFLLTTFLGAGITYLAVFINQILIDHILPTYQINTLVLFAIGVAVFFTADLIFSSFKRFFSIHLGNTFDKHFLSVFDDRLNKYSIRYLESFRRGDLVERLNDSMKIKSFFMTFFSQIFVNAIVAFFSIAILMMINWQLTVIVLLVFLLFMGLFYALTPYIKKLEQERFAKKADFFSRFMEKIDGLQVIKSLQLEHYSSAEIRANVNSLIKVRTKSDLLGLLNSVVGSLIISISTLAIIVLASREMILYNSITLGMIITFIALSIKIFDAFSDLLDYNLTLQEHQVILNRYFDFKDPEVRSNQLSPRDQLQAVQLKQLQLEDIFFAYRDEDYVLSGLKLNIKVGQKIWIKGRNGSGKSTLCKILSFLYQPTKGKILINGLDAGVYEQRRLRSKVAFVSGDDLLFNESILFNISFGQQVDIKQLIRLAKALDFYDFIDSQADGFNYVVHERGKNLSTGQRRKLLLLRALMSEADLIILDEIFNGIDQEAKYKAEMLLNSLDEQSFIIISHMPVEEINFDQKYKLENGYLLEQAAESIYAH